MDGHAGMPWRGPGPGRPNLPLPPGPMPLVSRASLRKNWRYIGYYGDEVMLCAAVARIGPFDSSFWSIWDREQATPDRPHRASTGAERGRDRGRTRWPDDARTPLRTGLGFAAARVRAEPVETICPSGRGWGWTRKRAGVPVTGSIAVDGRSWQVDGRGVDDHSAGYQARHTTWSWSAGVGRSTDGHDVAWNLTAGINDPVTGSERSVWIDGRPAEVEPVVFLGLDGLRSLGGEQLDFHYTGAERRRHDDLGLVRSDYVHRFGTFTGEIGGVSLAEGSGVMEEHDALW